MNVRRNSITEINLGIDFGTSFTKVCYRFTDIDQSGVVNFGNGNNINQAIVPSVVQINTVNEISIEGLVKAQNLRASIPYLKMKLADLSQSSRQQALEVKSFSSWYLATLIRLSKDWIEKNESQRIYKRNLRWSANIGVPVAHCDSVAIVNFLDVMSVAWEWEYHNKIPKIKNHITQEYQRTLNSLNRNYIDCHPKEEIAAAMMSYVNSRESKAGIFVYFDIGGGTLDGVSFNLIESQNRSVNFYSGDVKPLGIESIIRRNSTMNAKLIRSAIASSNQINQNQFPVLEEIGFEIQSLVAKVVMAIQTKDPLKLVGGHQSELPIFLGGGGADSHWYANKIMSVYEKFGHGPTLIPKYRRSVLSKPSDLNMNGLPDDEFKRYAVAYGLSVPAGEWPTIRLPRSVKPHQPKPAEPSISSLYPSRDFRD